MAACILDMLDEDKQKTLHGRISGAKNVCRARKKLKNMLVELGCYAHKAYHMSFDAFTAFYDVLKPKLLEEFNVGDCASVYDIILMHGIGKLTVYDSVYGIVNVLKEDKSLLFNANGAPFPSHDEQREIAEGFRLKSDAIFNKIVLTIDSMLIWTVEPSKADCDFLKTGQRLFHCYRKDKYDWLLMAECNHKIRFHWADSQHSLSTSDYLAWTTSEVGLELVGNDSDLILPEYTISTIHADERHISLCVHWMPRHPPAVSLNMVGLPQDLVGFGNHFQEEPGGMGRRPEAREQETPMQKMMKQVTKSDLHWPDLE
ncbi:hypothetical protein ACHAW6_009555 [Cyclotella cf. meneghiniana]